MARILVIDDENNIRLMVRLALQSAGHAVETASDGAEGLGKFGDGALFDVVLLDQRMPGLSGLEVLRAIKTRQNAARVVMMSAFGTVDLVGEARQSGALDFLRKPFTLETLREVVQSATQKPSQDCAAPSKTVEQSLELQTSLNGFRLTSSTRSVESSAEKGAIQRFFDVARAQEVTTCEVVVPRYVVEVVKAYADCEQMPDAEHFWLWLCEESLANYLWQNAELPPQNTLQLDDLSTHARRWIDAILAK